MNSEEQEHRGCIWLVLAFVAAVFAPSFWVDYHPFPESPFEYVIQRNLASSISNRLKFELDFSDNAFIDDITGQNDTGLYDWVFNFDGSGKTINHSPAIPFIRGMTKRAFSRSERVVPFLGRTLFLVAFLWLVLPVSRQFGAVGVLVFIVTISADLFIHTSGNELFLTSLLTLAFGFSIRAIDAPEGSAAPIFCWPLAGGISGATTMFRETFTYVVVLALILSAACLAIRILKQRQVGKTLEHAALFLVGFIIVAAPWWARNCRAAESFMPLGTGVSSRSIAGFSDSAWSKGGNFDESEMLRLRDQVMLASFEETLIEKEIEFAEKMSEQAADWRDSNSDKLVSLAASKVGHHLGVFNLIELGGKMSPFWIMNAILLIGALFGCVIHWRSVGIPILILVSCSIVVTAFTWSEFGRLFIPFRPLIHVAFAGAVAAMFSRNTAKQSDAAV